MNRFAKFLCDFHVYSTKGCWSIILFHGVQGNNVEPSLPSQSTNSGKIGSNSLEAPSFSRPAQVEPGISTFKGGQGCRYTDPAPEGPIFARPIKEEGQPQFRSVEKTPNFAQAGELRSCSDSFH